MIASVLESVATQENRTLLRASAFLFMAVFDELWILVRLMQLRHLGVDQSVELLVTSLLTLLLLLFSRIEHSGLIVTFRKPV